MRHEGVVGLNYDLFPRGRGASIAAELLLGTFEHFGLGPYARLLRHNFQPNSKLMRYLQGRELLRDQRKGSLRKGSLHWRNLLNL